MVFTVSIIFHSLVVMNREDNGGQRGDWKIEDIQIWALLIFVFFKSINAAKLTLC